MANIYFVDGKFVEDSEAVFPINDLGLLRGYGCFDFMRTYNRRLIFLPDHILRLQRSAAAVGIDLPWNATEISQLVEETLQRNPPVESSVRILVTGGSSPDFITPQGRPRLAILVAPAAVYPASWYRDGAHILTVLHHRTLPEAKSTDYLRGILALAAAREKGAIEAVYCEPEGWVREGTTSNIFAVIGGRVVTPEVGVLIGITRQKVLGLLEEKLPCELREMHHRELVAADEVFITSTNRQIVPIVRVDEARIGDGRPGPATRSLMQAFADYTARLSATGA
jgi:branched-chain amino acid aminotransferase